MNPWIATRAICFILSAFLLLPRVTLSQTPPQPGQLRITSTPSGAQVTVNGTSITQKTPVTLSVAPGTYTITVTGVSGQSTCSELTFVVPAGGLVATDCSGGSWRR